MPSGGRCPLCLTGPSAGSAWLADSSSRHEAQPDWEHVSSSISLPPSQDPSSVPDTPWGQFPRLLSTQFQPHSCLTLVGSSLVLSESCHTALGFGRARETPVWGWAWGLSSISSGLAAAVCSVFPRGTGTRATPAYSSASWNSHSRSVSVKFLSHSCSHRCLQRTPCMLVLASQGIVHTAASLIHRKCRRNDVCARLKHFQWSIKLHSGSLAHLSRNSMLCSQITFSGWLPTTALHFPSLLVKLKNLLFLVPLPQAHP